MELVQPSDQLIKAEGLSSFQFCGAKKSEQEFFHRQTKVEVLDFLHGLLPLTSVLQKTMRIDLILFKWRKSTRIVAKEVK